jgi:DegT/DnrJ/EryC1/StrS aminotransferase family
MKTISMIPIAYPLLGVEEQEAVLWVEAIATANNLTIVEDAYQLHGAQVDGKCVGSFTIGCFSFYATNNITTSEGGIGTTNDLEIEEQVHLLHSYRQLARYLYTDFGFSQCITEINGALGAIQLEKLRVYLRSYGIGIEVQYTLPIQQQPFYREYNNVFRLDASSMDNHNEQYYGDAYLSVKEKTTTQVLSLDYNYLQRWVKVNNGSDPLAAGMKL